MKDKLKMAKELLDQAAKMLKAAGRLMEEPPDEERAKTPDKKGVPAARDAGNLLRAVCAASDDAGDGVTVGQVITQPDAYRIHHGRMELLGVALTEGRPGPRKVELESKKFAFVYTEQVKRKLLAATAWKHLDIEQMLLRLQGAQHAQRRVAGKRVWGVEIPVALVREVMAAGQPHAGEGAAGASEGRLLLKDEVGPLDQPCEVAASV